MAAEIGADILCSGRGQAHKANLFRQINRLDFGMGVWYLAARAV